MRHPRSLARSACAIRLVGTSVRPSALSLLRSSNSNFCPILTSGDGRPDHCTRCELIMYPMTRLCFRAGLHVQDFGGYLKVKALGLMSALSSSRLPSVMAAAGVSVLFGVGVTAAPPEEPIPPWGNYCFWAELLCPFLPLPSLFSSSFESSGRIGRWIDRPKSWGWHFSGPKVGWGFICWRGKFFALTQGTVYSHH